MNYTSKTNWDKVDALGEEDIDTSDIPPLTDEFFAKAVWRKPKKAAVLPRVPVTVQVDKDTLAWFEAQGPDYEQRLSAALRVYADAHKAAV